MRDGAAQRFVAEREQIGERTPAARDDDDVDLLDGRQILQRTGDRRRCPPVLNRSEGPHQAARPAAPAQGCKHVVARLSALAGDDADRSRQRGPVEQLLRLEQSLGVEPAAQLPRAARADPLRRRVAGRVTSKENPGDAVRLPG